MDSDTKARPSVLSKILGPQSAEAAADPGDSGKEIRQAIDTPMLDVVMRDGSVESFAYAYLTRVSYTPGDRLVLYFGEDRVVVEGRNLREARQKLRLHRRDSIREGVEAESILKPEDAEHIDRIRLAITHDHEQEGDAAYERGNRKGFSR